MNTATANLENDHVHILQLINVMERITQLKQVEVSHLESIVSLIRNYADGLHHAKEEKLLFPKMVEKGYSFEQGPIAVMLHDHEEGRNFVRGMAEHIALYKEGNISALDGVFSNMKGYIDLLRAHIAKENNVLF
jgi:hemerythrin-like domain-containing protein